MASAIVENSTPYATESRLKAMATKNATRLGTTHKLSTLLSTLCAVKKCRYYGSEKAPL